ncbi:MAG: hypothetical protein BMS9Abin15_1209 [Gammaproteobacteria bacterium]|nr:MAG: hypothetical protein BMS9Abin15_1209 [Gammaproteobacteria bacterium]
MNEHADRDKRDAKRVAFVAPQGKEPRVYPWVSIIDAAVFLTETAKRRRAPSQTSQSPR